jgi:hypothetical protein
MRGFRRRQKKARQWIKGPLRDWVVPYRCNAWFQLGNLLLAAVVISAMVFWKTKSIDAVAVGYVTLLLSSFVLGMTEFGRGTVRAYRRTRGIIEDKGKLGKRVQATYGKKLYCVRAGVRTAAVDYGISRDLIPALANKWKPY